MVTRAHITAGAGRYGGRVAVGGTDISDAVSTVLVRLAAGDIPSAQLDLPLITASIDGDVHVSVIPRVHDALVALGWTPPPETGP